MRRSTSERTLLLVLAHERQRPGVAFPDPPGGPERLLEAPGLAAGLDDGVGAVGDVGPDVGVTVGKEVGGAQPAVVLVDAQEPRLDFEQAHHVDHGVDRGEAGAFGQVDVEVRDLALGDPDHAHGAQADVAGRGRGVVPLVTRQPERHRHDGDDARRTQGRRGGDRHDLDHPAVDVVVVGHGVRREDHGHARRRDGAVHHVDRAGGLGRRRGAGVGFHQRAVLGDVAQDAGARMRSPPAAAAGRDGR